jgi:aryl-alcohol dehydrogenase-like predicted oxidoreductase
MQSFGNMDSTQGRHRAELLVPGPERAWCDEGITGAIGVGNRDTAMLTRFACETDIDVVMLAGRYTLLDRPLEGA